MRKKFFASPAARRAVSAAMAMAIAFSMNVSPLSAIADSLITPVSASQASYSVVHVPEGDYYIVSSSSDDFCLDVMGGSTQQCAGLWLWTKSAGNPAQIYSLKHISGDWYIIEHKASGMTLNLPNANNANGQTLWLWPYDGTDACLWRFADGGDGTYVLQNKLGRVLDLDNNLLFDGSRVHVWDLHGGASCKWELQPVNASSISAVSNTTLYVTTSGTTSRLNLRSGPSTSYSSLAKLSFGTKVTLLGEYNNGWSKVKTNDGLIGYVSSQYLSTSDPSAITFSSSATSTVISSDNLTVSNRAKENGIKYSNNPGQRSPDALIQVVDQYQVTSNPRYRRTNNATYCNIFSWDVTRALNAELPHWVKNNKPVKSYTNDAEELNVNATCNWLKNYGSTYGWTTVSAEEAQSRANSGFPTVAIWKNPSGAPGHIAIVMPEGDGYYYSNIRGPVISQAGASNYTRCNVSTGFGSSLKSSVVYYTHD